MLSDEEIDSLVMAYLGDCGPQAGRIYSFTRAVLAKWGTPQPANLGFAIENRAGVDVLVWKDGGCRPATSAEVAMWKALAAVQQPVVQEPLTQGQIESLLWTYGYDPDDDRMVAILQAARGIAQKGGSDDL